MPTPDPIVARQKVIASVRRMVVKVGSRLLTDMPGVSKQERIEQLVAEIDAVRRRGIEVILVTSGAISTGLKRLGLTKRPTDLPQLQALAAVGQCRLMSLYEQACHRHGFHCGQILISADDVQHHQRHLNIRNCLATLLADGVLPIINENDTVSVEEIQFGDNDRLAALVGCLARAELTVLLTNVDGLRQREGDRLGERIAVVPTITRETRSLAGGTDGNAHSVGGMVTKLDAADIAVSSGDSLWIANGTDFGVLRQVLDGADVGTLFLAAPNRLHSAKRYLAFFAEPGGRIAIDDGAATALRERGKSLLPAGIRAVDGEFAKGDTVHLTDLQGRPVGMGVSNYAAADLRRIMGQKTSAIATILGHHSYDEAIHRDNLVILD